MSNQPNPQKRNKKKSQEKQRWLRRRQYNNLRFSALSMLAIAASFLLILLFLLVFPRSKVSEIENRNLANFQSSHCPAISPASLPPMLPPGLTTPFRFGTA